MLSVKRIARQPNRAAHAVRASIFNQSDCVLYRGKCVAITRTQLWIGQTCIPLSSISTVEAKPFFHWRWFWRVRRYGFVVRLHNGSWRSVSFASEPGFQRCAAVLTTAMAAINRSTTVNALFLGMTR